MVSPCTDYLYSSSTRHMSDVAEGIHFRFRFLVEIDPLSFDSPRSWEGCNAKKKFQLRNALHDKNSSEKKKPTWFSFQLLCRRPRVYIRYFCLYSLWLKEIRMHTKRD